MGTTTGEVKETTKCCLACDRTEKRLHVSRNYSEKLGIQGFFAAFLRFNFYFVANFQHMLKDETAVFK